MKTSSYPEITDELLSAYIDNAVSDAERVLVEQAVHEDTTVAWRLATLRETVNLLRTMPVLPAPRAFTLTAEQLGHPVRTPALVPGVIAADARSAPAVRPAKPSPQPGRWTTLLERWRGFWQTGSPVWRNAMAASMALLLVMVVAPAFLGDRGQSEYMAAAPDVLLREVEPAVQSLAASEMQDAETIGESGVSSAPEIAGVVDLDAPAEQAAVQENRMESQAGDAPALMQEEAVIAAAPLAQSADTATARIMAPSTLEDDPLNPQPPVEEVAGAGYGMAAAEMAPAAAASLPEPALLSPLSVLAGESVLPGEPVVQSVETPIEGEQAAAIALTSPTSAPVSTGADTDGIVPAPAAMSESATVSEATAVLEATADQQAGAQPTVVAYAPSDQQAEARAKAAAPPVRDVAAVEVAHLLPWLQLALLGAVIVFGLLWRHSRRNA